LTVIEQISYLMFYRLLDQAESVKERRALRLKKPYRSIYDVAINDSDEHLRGRRAFSGGRTGRHAFSRSGSQSTQSKKSELVRWSSFSKIADSEEMLRVVRDEVFPFLRKLGEQDKEGAGQYMKDATLMIVSAKLLYNAVGAIGRLPLDGDRK